MKKTYLTLSAFVVAITLLVCGGCTDPETIAEYSADETLEVDRTAAARDIAADAEDRSPAADRDADSSEPPKATESNKLEGSDPPLAGDRDNRESSAPEETHTAARGLASLGSSAGMNEASGGDLDSNSKKTDSANKKPPREEFKFEFVSSTGEEGLEPGDTIPEITGKDLDNIQFNLSDYQGKVIMLDFWGDW